MTQAQPNSGNKSDTKPPPASSDHLHNILGSKYITIPILGAALGGVLGASLKGQNRISDETSFMFPVAGALLALTTMLAQEQETDTKRQLGWPWSGIHKLWSVGSNEHIPSVLGTDSPMRYYFM